VGKVGDGDSTRGDGSKCLSPCSSLRLQTLKLLSTEAIYRALSLGWRSSPKMIGHQLSVLQISTVPFINTVHVPPNNPTNKILCRKTTNNNESGVHRNGKKKFRIINEIYSQDAHIHTIATHIKHSG